MRSAAALLALALLMGACAAGSTTSPGSTPIAGSDERSAAPTPTSGELDDAPAQAAAMYPGPRSDLPGGARVFASELDHLQSTIGDVVRRWLRAGGPWPHTSKPNDVPAKARDLMFGALYQQRMFRQLAAKPRFAERVLRLLPRRHRVVVAEHLNTARGLSRLVTPLEPPIDMRVTPPDSPHLLKRIYDRTAKRFGIHWSLLASLNFVESKFGRFMGPSSAGALGPMQFMPATWDAYGNGGNVWDPRDAIPGAARYLVASGAHSNLDNALYAYNHSWDYVRAIKTYARNIRRDARNYYVYYFWQVFVLTTKGPLQLTGPGARA